MIKTVILPPDASGSQMQARQRRPSRLYTLLGGNGSGKSLFMNEIAKLNQSDSYLVSAVSDGIPAKVSGSLPRLMSEIIHKEGQTQFHKLKEIWEETFPGNEISVVKGKTAIRNRSGKDSIGIKNLSRGEKAGLYYLASIILAPENSLVLVDSPTLFLHPTVVGLLWEKIERLRADCRFVYDTNDANFASGHTRRTAIWIKEYDAAGHSWHYQVLAGGELPDEIFLQMMGSRRPILFTEGDTSHSIDIRLYSVVFPEYTVKPLGSCDKVIESTRTMQALKAMHRIESYGLIDRDRRSDQEVEYLRAKKILVPEVAEIENIFLSQGVVETMAEIKGKNPKKVMKAVRQEVIRKFEEMLDAQALQHTRHRMKRDVERKIDAKFTCITALELHIKSLIKKLKPRETYQQLLAEFRRMAHGGDYEGILRVFNHKPMFTGSCVAKLLGFPNIDEYVSGVISAMKHNDAYAQTLRREVRNLFS